MTQVFEQQLEDIQEIVPDFYIANATIHFDEHFSHMHIVGVPVKENCKTGLSKTIRFRKTEEQNKKIKANNRRFNLFNKREIEKAPKHINYEMDESAEDFYKTKREKDNEISL